MNEKEFIDEITSELEDHEFVTICLNDGREYYGINRIALVNVDNSGIDSVKLYDGFNNAVAVVKPDEIARIEWD
jgi:hypothetical protein